jgi:2-amino-4-hydroxy-6-hydroxymethyldihydropteridine diphosphokinase
MPRGHRLHDEALCTRSILRRFEEMTRNGWHAMPPTFRPIKFTSVILRSMPTAYIGLGANLPSHAGSPEATLAAAALRLESLGRLIARSSLYSTEPVGFADQPRFFNAAVALETELIPHALLNQLLSIEREFGRDRSTSFRNGPRTLDLDILLFGDLIVAEPDLEIPHPRLAQRAFVLVPLAQIAPRAIDPASGLAIEKLLSALNAADANHAEAVVPLETPLWRALNPPAPPR